MCRINYVAQVENCDDVAVEDDISLERTAFYGLEAKDGFSRCLDFLDIMKALRLSSLWRGKTKTGQNRVQVPVLLRSCRVLRCRPLRNLRLVLPSGLR